MVKRGKKDNRKTPAGQAFQASGSEANKIGASTPYDFTGKNLTAVGGLVPITTMLEKLEFQKLVEETITTTRITRVMGLYKFVVGIVLGFYVGFQRLNQLRFIARDPLLTGILGVEKLPPQSTLWRFLDGLYVHVAGQILKIQQVFRQRVWEAANVKLTTVTLDTDTTVQTVYGKQMGARRSYKPEEQRKAQLSADFDVHCRNAGVHLWRLAQWASAQRPGNQGTPSEGHCLTAGWSEADIWARRFGLLLPRGD